MQPQIYQFIQYPDNHLNSLRRPLSIQQIYIFSNYTSSKKIIQKIVSSSTNKGCLFWHPRLREKGNSFARIFPADFEKDAYSCLGVHVPSWTWALPSISFKNEVFCAISYV
jgi:hypothetical protein